MVPDIDILSCIFTIDSGSSGLSNSSTSSNYNIYSFAENTGTMKWWRVASGCCICCYSTSDTNNMPSDVFTFHQP